MLPCVGRSGAFPINSRANADSEILTTVLEVIRKQLTMGSSWMVPEMAYFGRSIAIFIQAILRPRAFGGSLSTRGTHGGLAHLRASHSRDDQKMATKAVSADKRTATRRAVSVVRLARTFVDLAMSPLCETYPSAADLNHGEVYYPLHVYVCEKCFLVQLEEYETAENIF